ncbi:SigE family RNA polymerase sigma factor [Motilibacter deserti]|uniref:SigE family RNA polymerase sigma factor n=1 Tax=Motilibacter deserti TaxID=2714956 RepID=UPI002F2B4F95
MRAHEADDFRGWAVTARPRLRRVAFLLCGDWHQAEDLTQDTLARVYSVWSRVTRTGGPDAYARQTLVNAYRALLRRPWRRETAVGYLEDDALGQAQDPSLDVSDRSDLLLALRTLGASQRAVVVLRYWEDLPVAEVAELLNVSTGTVKSQAARGLANLREALPTHAVQSGANE